MYCLVAPAVPTGIPAVSIMQIRDSTTSPPTSSVCLVLLLVSATCCQCQLLAGVWVPRSAMEVLPAAGRDGPLFLK